MMYEIVFVLDSKKADDGGEKFTREAEKLIAGFGGQVKKRTSMGRKHFSRAIGKRRAGLYWDLIAELAPAQVEPFRDKYRLDDTVVRLEVFRAEEKAAKRGAGAGS